MGWGVGASSRPLSLLQSSHDFNTQWKFGGKLQSSLTLKLIHHAEGESERGYKFARCG